MISMSWQSAKSLTIDGSGWSVGYGNGKNLKIRVTYLNSTMFTDSVRFNTNHVNAFSAIVKFQFYANVTKLTLQEPISSQNRATSSACRRRSIQCTVQCLAFCHKSNSSYLNIVSKTIAIQLLIERIHRTRRWKCRRSIRR